MRIALQPAGSKASREHYRDTIEQPVSLDDCEGLLPDATLHALEAAFPDGKAAMWGVTPGVDGGMAARYEKMTPGDYVLFARSGTLFWGARVALMFRSDELALKLWGRDDKGQTWEYMYALDDPRTFELPVEGMNAAVGYKSNNVVQGFSVLDEVKSAPLADLLGLGAHAPYVSPLVGKSDVPKANKHWMTEAFRAWTVLTRAAKQSEKMTYQELAEVIGAIPVSVGKILDPIQEHCIEEGLPRLTGLVVAKGSDQPSAGFKGTPEDYEAEMEAVFAFDWEGIENPFPPSDVQALQAVVFGEVEGVSQGDVFDSYEEMRSAGVHRHVRQGIAGNKKDGADSIVLGGHYDDDDAGDVIYYTGQGGQVDGEQVEAQSLKRMRNPALVRSMDSSLPVRVIRSSNSGSNYAPDSGYRYDGLYQVIDAAEVKGSAGLTVCRFKLVKLGVPFADTYDPKMDPTSAGQQVETSSPGGADPAVDSGPAPMEEVTLLRRVRDSKVTRAVKAAHSDTCQICGTVVMSPKGTHAEGCHIKPISKQGPDIESNVLCLCPNCHVRFDNGALLIEDDLSVHDLRLKKDIGLLTTVPGHTVSPEMLAWHREHRS
jgi:putative restriction endonuclease